MSSIIPTPGGIFPGGGGAGGDGSPGAVRYDVVQALSDPQKGVARTNIGAMAQVPAAADGNIAVFLGGQVVDGGATILYLLNLVAEEAAARVAALAGKADKIAGGTNGNLVTRDSLGNIADAGVAVSTDGTLAANSDAKVSTQRAVKTYVDARTQPATATVAGIVKQLTSPGVAPADTSVRGDDLRLVHNGSLSIEHFGALGDGTTDDTAAIQAALDYVSGKPIILTSADKTYMVSQLALPANIIWEANGSIVKAISGSNRAVLVNANPVFQVLANIVDENIRISGLTIDHDGNAQADAETSGVWNCPIRLTGVRNLTLTGLTVLRQKRFGCTVVNSEHSVIEAFFNPSTAAGPPNQDGLHINGPCRGLVARIRCENTNDDALALNADDADYGGGYSGANVAGIIENVVADLVVKDSSQAVRLLSATMAIRNCEIRCSGNTTKTGIIIESYGLGSSSLYQNIIFDDFDLVYGNAVTYPMVLIDTSTQAAGTRSDFTFRRLAYKGSGGTSHHVVKVIGKDTDINIGELIADGHGFSNHLGVVRRVNCTGGVNIHVGSLVMRNTNNAATAYPMQSENSVGGSIIIDHLDVDSVRMAFICFGTSANSVDVFRCYSPNPATVLGGVGTFLAGDNCTIGLSEITGPWVQTKSGYGSGKRWGLSAVGSASITKDLPNYLGGQTADRPSGMDIGTEFWDLDLGIPIYWNGSVWKDSAGVTV